MTKPRRHIAGQVALLTRHCTGRQFLLRPDDFINQALSFETAKAASKNCVAIYGAMAMMNHIHYGVGDILAKRSFFMQSAMSGVAKARNFDLQREGHFWGSGSYGDVVLLDRDAIEYELIRMWTAPVRAGLVERAVDWIGFKILPSDWGKTIEIERPEKFYGRKNPAKVKLCPAHPPGYEGMTPEEIAAYYEAKLRKEEERIVRERKRAGLGISGVKEVLDVEPSYSPKLEWPPPQKINPRFSTNDSELMFRAVTDYKEFCKEYENCRQRWLQRKAKEVRFPCGTLALKYRAPIKCSGPPDDEPGLMACQA